MKRIIRKPTSVSSSYTENVPPNAPIDETVEYPHDSTLLEEMAGYSINERLFYTERERPEILCREYRLRFGKNLDQASLYVNQVVSHELLMTARNVDDVKRHVVKQMVDEVLTMAQNKIDTVHKLENSWWKRLVYVFTKKA